MQITSFEDISGDVRIGTGDCLQLLKLLPDNSIDSIITDPPYHLTTKNSQGGFMGQKWDGGDIAFNPDVWKEILRVAKPGALLFAFGGTRTFHRLTCAIEDAGWEIKDTMMFLYATGMPKGISIDKAIDRNAGVERKVIGSKIGLPGYSLKHSGCGGVLSGRADGSLDNSEKECSVTEPATPEAKLWEGWNSTLKPAWEPIIIAMKPLEGSFVENALKWGVAGFNIDACRIEYRSKTDKSSATPQGKCSSKKVGNIAEPDIGREVERVDFERPEQKGRWPANVILDEESSQLLDAQTGILKSGTGAVKKATAKGNQGFVYGTESRPVGTPNIEYGDSGGASRFFYCSKSSKSERNEGLPEGVVNHHPTCKPVNLMEYLCKLSSTPTGGIVLDPFMGSGTTGVAAIKTGRKFIGCDLDADYVKIAEYRIKYTMENHEIL